MTFKVILCLLSLLMNSTLLSSFFLSFLSLSLPLSFFLSPNGLYSDTDVLEVCTCTIKLNTQQIEQSHYQGTTRDIFLVSIVQFFKIFLIITLLDFLQVNFDGVTFICTVLMHERRQFRMFSRSFCLTLLTINIINEYKA